MSLYQVKLLSVMGKEELPSNATYGDGTPITIEELDAVRRAYHESEVVYPWQRGDLLVVDNVLVAHGRKPFHGPRRVLAAMSG